MPLASMQLLPQDTLRFDYADQYTITRMSFCVQVTMYLRHKLQLVRNHLQQ